MNLEDYRTVFIVTCLVLVLVAASPGLSVVFPLSVREQYFSELWILGPNHVAWDYPFNVHVNESHRIFVGVTNHLGRSAYYMVCAKLRNATEPFPNGTISEPSPLVFFYEFRVFVAYEETYERPLVFSILDISIHDGLLSVGGISVNDVVFPVNASAIWDSDQRGFRFQLFFELWLYGEALHGFEFHNRFVGIWFNVMV